jgi:hypothetical protein
MIWGAVTTLGAGDRDSVNVEPFGSFGTLDRNQFHVLELSENLLSAAFTDTGVEG